MAVPYQELCSSDGLRTPRTPSRLRALSAVRFMRAVFARLGCRGGSCSMNCASHPPVPFHTMATCRGHYPGEFQRPLRKKGRCLSPSPPYDRLGPPQRLSVDNLTGLQGYASAVSGPMAIRRPTFTLCYGPLPRSLLSEVLMPRSDVKLSLRIRGLLPGAPKAYPDGTFTSKYDTVFRTHHKCD